VVNTELDEVELKSVDPQLDVVKKHLKGVLPDDCPSPEKWL